MFTVSRLHAVTYLLGVCLFSISFLVFLNSSISFVITDLIGRHYAVGDAVGTLGFADELLALVACPTWGILSDIIGVRTVCVVGYIIIGLALFIFVQARNVYPQLLLARLLFALGACATATMVTAILPSMTAPKPIEAVDTLPIAAVAVAGHASPATSSESSEITITPERFERPRLSRDMSRKSAVSETSARLSGFVGMFTGCGALVALTVFLPLPARFQSSGASPAQAVTDAFYTVGSVSFVVAIFCFIGLRGVDGSPSKGWKPVLKKCVNRHDSSTSNGQKEPWWRLLYSSISLAMTHASIGLGYLGGFVARASSVGITLFIPLYVNAYFIRSGICDGDQSDHNAGDIKQSCRRAYVLAAELTGVSQLVALVSAPIFGYLYSRCSRYNLPLLGATIAGVVGYTAFALLPGPEPSGEHGSPFVFVLVSLMGISQIGAIVCSLSLVSRGVLEGDEHSEIEEPNIASEDAAGSDSDEDSPLLNLSEARHSSTSVTASTATDSTVKPFESRQPLHRTHLKGSIAGVYSLCGGAGILLLTKLGGLLFDRWSVGAPFYMLAIFNGILLLGTVISDVRRIGKGKK